MSTPMQLSPRVAALLEKTQGRARAFDLCPRRDGEPRANLGPGRVTASRDV